MKETKQQRMREGVITGNKGLLWKGANCPAKKRVVPSKPKERHHISGKEDL